jgi:hypothetical protein
MQIKHMHFSLNRQGVGGVGHKSAFVWYKLLLLLLVVVVVVVV